jgi:DnaJ-class molecular chaperone
VQDDTNEQQESIETTECFRCDGTKLNKKGNSCKKCDGTGQLGDRCFKDLRKILVQEVKKYCAVEY